MKADNADADMADSIQNNVALFESLLPEGGIARLFESKTCTLCKKEPKGIAKHFAILDFGHSEPKTMRARRLFYKSDVGFIMPLQFACCKQCSRRMVLASYMPLLVPTVLTALLIPFYVSPHLMQVLRRAASWLPLLLTLVTTVGGYFLGKALQRVLQKRFDRIMYFDLLKHPVAVALQEKGWFPLYGEKTAQPVFSRKRLYYGIGNAPSDAYSEQREEKIPVNRENID